MFGVFFQIRTVEAQGTITIHSDGSFSPGSAALVVTEDFSRKVYTFTSDISDSTIVVQRDSVTINGTGRSLFGNSGIDAGIELQDVTGISIINLKIEGFQNGIKMIDSGVCSIYGNNITNNVRSGIELSGESYWNNIQGNTIKDHDGAGINFTGDSSHSTIVSNIIEENQVGIDLRDLSKENIIGNNAFINNIRQFGDYNNQVNRWNRDYGGSTGNYWSDYESRGYLLEDLKHGENQDLEGRGDGIWDNPYYIYRDEDVKDNYPLVENPVESGSTITCTRTPDSDRINTYFDDDVRIHGHITPNVIGAIVTITIRSNATNSQEEQVPVTTNQHSGYEYWLRNIGYPLEFEVEASWDGNSEYNGASSEFLSFETYWSDQPEDDRNWWEIIFGDIPGFPWESILIGALLGLGTIHLLRKKKISASSTSY